MLYKQLAVLITPASDTCNVSCTFGMLTYLPLDKMAAILQIFSGAFFENEKFCSLIKISMKFVPKGPIEKNPALV